MKFAPIDARSRLCCRSSAAKGVAGFANAALLAAGLLIAPALAPVPAMGTIPTASAAGPDAEVDFARGREEAPGVGEVGQAFIKSLQSKVPHMSIGEYGVNVAAVALFGNGTRAVLGPVPDFSPAFAGKTIDLCAAGDPICTGGVHDLHWSSHLQPSYISSGLVDQAASFVAGKL
jgi:cutinase-like protein